MDEEIGKRKMGPLLVLETLKKYTDKKHYLTQNQIASKIEKDWDILYERKSIADSLSLLEDMYDIDRKSGKGVALIRNGISAYEMRLIMDALMTARFLDGKTARRLIDKLGSKYSVEQKKIFRSFTKAEEIDRHDNEELSATLEAIANAIESGKKLSFQYFQYNEKGELQAKRGGWRYRVSPYRTLISNGRYYLLCSSKPESDNPLTHYRIEYIRNAEVEEESLVPLRELKGQDNFDFSEYMRNHLYQLDGELITASFELETKGSIHTIYDWFAKKNVRFLEKDGKIIAKIRGNSKSLFYWYMQYSETLKVLGPQSLVEDVKKEAKSILEKHSDPASL